MPVKVLPNQTIGVKLSKYFAQTTEVTKGFYYSVMKDNPNGLVVTQPLDSEKNKPVECGFFEAITFCNRLSKQCGLTPVYAIFVRHYFDNSKYVDMMETDPDLWDFQFCLNNTGSSYYYNYIFQIDQTANGFRMPSDAEYLYAMGSGYNAVMSGGVVDHYVWKDSNNVSHNISDIGWTSETNVLEPQTVAQKIPNENGLYDLSGNVSEWVVDRTSYFDAPTNYAAYSDNTVNYISPSNMAGTSYLTKQNKHNYYNGATACYNNIVKNCLVDSKSIDDGGSYLKNESYAVPYSDTKYPTNNNTRNTETNSTQLASNGDGTFSATVSKGFRIVKQTAPYLIDKWGGEYKFLMPGSASFEPIPLRKITAGCFYQGAQNTNITMPNYDINAQADESPVHKVLLTSDFYIGIEKIPVNLWLAIMTTNKNYISNVAYSNITYMNGNSTSYNLFNSGRIYNDSNYCLYNMLNTRAKPTWRKIMVFCNRLSRILGLEPVYHLDGNYNEEEWFTTTTGNYMYCDYINNQNASSLVDTIQVDKSKHGFRLPTESEFEYVCKGGILKDTFLYPGSNDAVETGTHITDSTKRSNQQYYNFIPNSLGIYDLASVVNELVQDASATSDSCFLYSDTTYYPQPRTGEDFVINPIVEATSSWDYSNRRCCIAKGVNTTFAYSYFSSNPTVGRNTSRKFAYSSAIQYGNYKYQNNASENFRLVLQSPEVLPENMNTEILKETKFINVILDYKQEPTNCIDSYYINDSRGYDHYNIRNYQLLPDKLSFNTIQVPISSSRKTIKIVYENQFTNYDNTLNSGTTSNIGFWGSNGSVYNYFIEVMEVPLTIEMYRALYPNCSELEYNNNYYADSNNDPASYRQYYGISWYKALEITKLLNEKLGYLTSTYYPIKINNSKTSWGAIPTDEASAIADYANYSGSGGCWNDPVIARGTSTVDNFYYVYTPSDGYQRTGWRLPTCLEMLYIAFGGDSRYDDTQLYPGSNEISDVSCFKIVDNSGNEVTDYTQVTNLTDYHLESKNGLTYVEGYSKNKMYKPNCFNIYDLATNCCLCYDFIEPGDTPAALMPLKLSNGTSGYRRCCVFGVPSGVDHTTDTNSLAHYSMRLFTEVKPWESYPFQSLRLVRTLSGCEY